MKTRDQLDLELVTCEFGLIIILFVLTSLFNFDTSPKKDCLAGYANDSNYQKISGFTYSCHAVTNIGDWYILVGYWDFCQTFSIGHWNLNSSVVQNFPKVALLRAYLSV